MTQQIKKEKNIAILWDPELKSFEGPRDQGQSLAIFHPLQPNKPKHNRLSSALKPIPPPDLTTNVSTVWHAHEHLVGSIQDLEVQYVYSIIFHNNYICT